MNKNDLPVESGTWTPSLIGAGGAVTTYTVQSGAYQRIGGLVAAWFEIRTSAHTLTGNLSIGGLPFALANSIPRPIGELVFNGITKTGATRSSLFGTEISVTYQNTGMTSLTSYFLQGTEIAQGVIVQGQFIYKI